MQDNEISITSEVMADINDDGPEVADGLVGWPLLRVTSHSMLF